ncbi:hypothetical protein [Flavobacterium sp. RSP15]|nr:hypothetical protein [Flavobacterium sp. RSP15]RTY85526.1 hypothetical protein EKM00_14295 [Flavobacterium sp. RSP15]
MKKVYHYIFYKLYRYMLSTPNSNLAVNGAVIYLCISLLFYSMTIDLLLNKFFKLHPMSGNLFMAIGLSYAFLIYYFNYWYFRKDGLYLKIEKRFINESEKQRVLGNIFVSVFVFGSIIIFMLTGFLVNKYYGGFK